MPVARRGGVDGRESATWWGFRTRSDMGEHVDVFEAGGGRLVKLHDHDDGSSCWIMRGELADEFAAALPDLVLRPPIEAVREALR